MKKQTKFQFILALFLLFTLSICSCKKETSVIPEKPINVVVIDSSILHVWNLREIHRFVGRPVHMYTDQFSTISWDIQTNQVCVYEGYNYALTTLQGCTSGVCTDSSITLPFEYYEVDTLTSNKLVLGTTLDPMRFGIGYAIYTFTR